MTDFNRMDRTWLCSVVFMDIAQYSSQSVELQMKWKARFNGYLASAIADVPEDERVILDTGDGAAICFLGAPEAAMFAALELWHSLLLDEREQQPQSRVRIGINLGPVKLVRDINGAPNAIGDGMNAGQRIMSFAAENQILVSQSFFEVVSRLSDDYKNLFTLKGVETDKHIREHTVYNLAPPGQVSVKTPLQAVPLPVAASPQPSAAPASVAQVAQTAPESRPENKAQGSRSILLLVGAIVLVVVAAGAATWHFYGSAALASPGANPRPATQGQITAPSPAVAPSATVPSPAVPSPAVPIPTAPSAAAPLTPAAAQAPIATAPSNPRKKQAVTSTPAANAAEEAPAPPQTAAVSAADQATARDLRQRYAIDAGHVATARANAEEMRRSLAAKGMSLNAQTAAALDQLGVLLDEAAEALRNHQWDDALSSLQAVEATTQKVTKAVGN